jgi:hypothetical protein
VPTISPLESFVRDYVESIGGAWDIVEPDVYDLLIPQHAGSADWDVHGRDMLRIAFDAEALPENPGAQLASFGTPLLEHWLEDAMRRGRTAELYVIGLNLAPHDLAARVRRALTLAPGLELKIERIRALDFPQALFWFQATFVSDQKEQEIVPVAIDLHYLRQTRHLEQLLDSARLAERPAAQLAEARRVSVAAAYPIAQERVLRTFMGLANVRSRELDDRTERQASRMTQYYADLRGELAEQRTRSENRHENSATDNAKFEGRLEALRREERLRIAELRQKNTLHVRLRLLNVLIVRQPKLLVRSMLVESAPAAASNTPPRRLGSTSHAAATRAPAPLDLVWDPLIETLEAPPCPLCGRPSYSFTTTRSATATCSDCASANATQDKLGRRH